MAIEKIASQPFRHERPSGTYDGDTFPFDPGKDHIRRRRGRKDDGAMGDERSEDARRSQRVIVTCRQYAEKDGIGVKARSLAAVCGRRGNRRVCAE